MSGSGKDQNFASAYNLDLDFTRVEDPEHEDLSIEAEYPDRMTIRVSTMNTQIKWQSVYRRLNPDDKMI